MKEQDFIDIDNIFSPYIWSENGICNKFDKMKSRHYGNDLKLVLFQFIVKPTSQELQNLKEIESYRKKEKAIGIPIIVTNENFFKQNENDRFSFLKKSILMKMDLLSEVVKKKKLDTNIQLLKQDLINCLN
ncbi:MAG: hypothetical protein IPO85_00320 [Saprospiraceae bacterium]|uniref:Uncharacterized protein n=1 Tax=Candidatus Defluviibacterium haderslevense TaxID=2981993 RepID=A0A9D7S5W2_9BACT|nr:hypothetical protein [Candidatus Defluviibacterium haderslevense]